ncbi:putative lipid II flippase FtsW [Patescibacteria group bacterium]|nr:putative lipid II flippase FtsW [Patescibacteria group bacterium]
MRKNKLPYFLVIVTFALVVIGLVMLSSASVVQSYESKGNNYYYLVHQLLAGAIPGLIALIIASFIDYKKWKKFAIPFLALTLFLLVLVFIPGIGFDYGGARRWIAIGGFTIQPTEIVKLSFLIYLATWIEKRESSLKDLKTVFLPFVTILLAIGFLIMQQPDLGTMSVIIFSAIAVYYVAGARLGHLAVLGFSGIGAILILIKMAPYRMARFTVFLNPELDPQGIGYQINQVLLAIGSGGLLGRGLGRSIQKYNYLPEATGDSIFAIIAEELGFVRIVLIILLFAALTIIGYQISKNAPDMFGKILAAGITTWLGFQAFVNIAAMLTLVPLTGIPLPFISYGGTALLSSLAAVGILINIARQSKA